MISDLNVLTSYGLKTESKSQNSENSPRPILNQKRHFLAAMVINIYNPTHPQTRYWRFSGVVLGVIGYY
jgi:hypothetical protein